VSVTGEFQRYLLSTVESLGKEPGIADGPPSSPAARLRIQLDDALLDTKIPLSDCAQQVLEALEDCGFVGNSGENAPPCDEFSPEVRDSAESLIALSRIVLGRSPPTADKEA